MDKELTIIVPVYNEEDNLERVEKELTAYAQSAKIPVQILFVNDGSKDKSQEIIEKICANSHIFKFVSFQENRGLSAAIKAGFDETTTSLVGYIDSDLQTSPSDFDLLLAHIGEYDLVTGVRANRKDSFVKNMSSKIANGIRRTFTSDGMDDTGCPLKIMKTDFAKEKFEAIKKAEEEQERQLALAKAQGLGIQTGDVTDGGLIKTTGLQAQKNYLSSGRAMMGTKIKEIARKMSRVFGRFPTKNRCSKPQSSASCYAARRCDD